MVQEYISRHLAFAAATLALLTGQLCAPAADLVSESTMPPQYKEVIKPELAQKYVYTQDGDYSKSLGIPTYEWMPANNCPRAIIIGVHGLTLHGRRYRVLARMLAANGVGFVAFDMRGFGRCRFDDNNVFNTDPKDDKRKVDHEKSYQNLVALTKLVNQKYPDLPIVVLGESLGCTFCVRVAGELPDVVDGIVLSAPAVHVNPKMYATPSDIKQGLKAIVSIHHEVDLHAFITQLVSSRQEVVDEMLDDPHILKKLPIGALLHTDEFVAKTSKWGKNVSCHLAVLIIQGSQDGCVAPKHVTDLMMNMPSENVRLAWRAHYGHLQLETMFMRAAIIDAIGSWLDDQSKENKVAMKTLAEDVVNAGGTVTP